MNSLTIIGRRWFNRAKGHSYHSASIHIDGEPICKVGETYGYDDHYLTTALEVLQSKGYLTGLTRNDNGSTEPLWSYCERNGIAFVREVIDVQRRKDL